MAIMRENHDFRRMIVTLRSTGRAGAPIPTRALPLLLVFLHFAGDIAFSAELAPGKIELPDSPITSVP
jgi:hypothetical protein